LENPTINPGGNDSVLLYTVNGQEFKSEKQYLTGAEIRKIANIEDQSESLLFLAVKHPWQDELIDGNKEVNLARPEIEHFYTKNILLLLINGKQYHYDKQYILGEQIKALGKIPLEDDLFLSIRGPWEDELISNEKEVNLARPGIEHFYSKQVLIYNFKIDKKSYTSAVQFLSVREILEDFANVEADKNTLAAKIEGGFKEYKNLDEKIDLSQTNQFTVFNNNPCNVS